VITGIDQVTLDVGDQDEATRFWVDAIGFELARDEYLCAERWIELRPPSGAPMLILSLREPHQARRVVADHLPHSNVFFTCDDIDRTYRELVEKGVRFPTPPTQMPWGSWAMFEDPDGTRFALGQQT
jgi:catechol 2,3-dioxygenase-like lactoylglutathione lyase family enzyme